MVSDFAVSNVLSASWKAFSSQVWILAGLLIGYIILSFTLGAVLQPAFSSSWGGLLFVDLLNAAISLIFMLGYLKNMFQALDGDEPRFSAYGQQAHKIGTLFVSSLLYGILVFVVALVTLLPYFYLLYDLSLIKETVLDPYSLPAVSDIEWLSVLFTALGVLCLLLPAMYFGIRFMFYQAFIVSDNVGIIDSLKKSWEITKGHTLSLFLLTLASVGITIAGLLLFVIGLFVAIPLVYMMYCCAFRKLNHYPAYNE
ncbi:MAG: DUF975 family protein [Tannerellaceae bacterium]|jgi:uncharacterized membrane protein|nr:DUF975 family protein [Tannerellaceae bacterium]